MKPKLIERDGEQYVVGPNGELRPNDPLASQTRSLEVLTGQREEEYIDEEHRIAAEERKLDEKKTIMVPNPETGELEVKVKTRRELMEEGYR